MNAEKTEVVRLEALVCQVYLKTILRKLLENIKNALDKEESNLENQEENNFRPYQSVRNTNIC